MSVKNLSPTQLAEAIGVQRSGISHILSGRNKPSLDFVLKVLAAFTDVNEAWLLTATGEMLKSTNNTPELFAGESKHDKESNNDKNQGITSLKSEEEPYYKADIIEPEIKQEKKISHDEPILGNMINLLDNPDNKKDSKKKAEKKLVKLIAIYSDDSFKIYHSE